MINSALQNNYWQTVWVQYLSKFSRNVYFFEIFDKDWPIFKTLILLGLSALHYVLARDAMHSADYRKLSVRPSAICTSVRLSHAVLCQNG